MTIDLSKLNPEQKQAVTHKEGPLLIIAGAGTGKTHVITSRILYLLEQEKVGFDEILALTFTEKATEEMVERIDTALPYSYEEIAIHTFHGFCDKILREYGLEIGLDTSYKILTQIDQWMFIKKNLFKFDLDYYRPLGNPNKFISALGTHFSRLKDEDISPEEYLKYAEKNSDEENNLLELANAYQKYQELMIAENMMDFNDLQYYVLRLFEKRPKILEKIQNRFKYILVDEFQDTNFAQSKIVLQLAKKHSNITVVGDDDQSIYRWRGASMNNFNEFEEEFPGSTKIVLKENYRSTPEILNVSYDLIQNNNPYRLESTHNIDKKLNSQKEAGKKTEIHKFNHYLNEVKFITDKIKELAKNNEGFKNIAILTRTHNIAKPFIEALKTHNIPFQVRNQNALTRLPEIKDLIAVLQFISNQKNDIALFRILQMPIVDVPMQSLITMVNKARSEQLRMFDILKEEKSSHPTLEVVYKVLIEVIEDSKKLNVSQILGKFLNKSEYLKKLQENPSIENDEKIINISEFFKLIQEYDSDHNDNNIYSFLEYLTMLEDAGAQLDNSLTEIDSDSVQILSIHAAKGLQFDNVFIPSLVQNRFPGINRKDPLMIPDELIKEDIPDKDMFIYEERRLMYVACTRAKEKLFLSYSEKYEGSRTWKPSRFINEIGESDFIEKFEHDEEIKVIEPEVEKSETQQAGIKTNITKYSYSKLDTFKTCPLKFKFRYLYSIPSPSAHAANFGTSVHNTLNDLYTELKNGNVVSLEKLEELYEKNWITKGYENRAHHNARKKQGLTILKNYYEKNSNPWIIPEMIEKPFNLKIGEYSLSGRIDRIDKLEDGTYEIIDYKTGKSKKNQNLDKDLQLSVYALAARDVYKIPVKRLSLYFLEDNEKHSTDRNDEQLEKAEQDILESATKVNESSFDATPGFLCQYCEYRLICNKAQ